MGIDHRIHAAQVMVPPVEHIDVVQPIPVGTQFPVAVGGQVLQFLRPEKFAVLPLQVVGVGRHHPMVIVLFQKFFCKHRRIPPAVLKVQQQGVLRQGPAAPVIFLHILAGDGDEAVLFQGSQMLVQQPGADQVMGAGPVHPEIGQGHEPPVHALHLVRPVGAVPGKHEQGVDANSQECHQHQSLEDGPSFFPFVLLPCVFFISQHDRPPSCPFPSGPFSPPFSGPPPHLPESSGCPRWISRR